MGSDRGVLQSGKARQAKRKLPVFIFLLAVLPTACRQKDHEVVVTLPSQEWVESSSYVSKGETKLGRVEHVLIGPQKTYVTILANDAQSKRMIETGPIVLKNGFLSIPESKSELDD